MIVDNASNNYRKITPEKEVGYFGTWRKLKIAACCSILGLIPLLIHYTCMWQRPELAKPIDSEKIRIIVPAPSYDTFGSPRSDESSPRSA